MEIIWNLSISWLELLVTIFLILFIYQFCWKNWSYFSDRNILFIRGIPIFGTNYKVLFGQCALSIGLQQLYQKYPNESLIGMYDIGGIPMYIVRDPELIKQITIKEYDKFLNHRANIDEHSDPLMANNLFFIKNDQWKEMRTTLSSSFTGSKMRQMFDLIIECSEEFVKYLNYQLIICDDKNNSYEMKEILSRFTNDTIATCAFGLKVNSMKDRENKFYKTGLIITKNTTKMLLKFLGFSSCPKLMNLLKIRIISKKNEQYFRDIVHQTIEYRKINNIQRSDMIDLLMKTNKDFTENDIVAQCMIFFIAGFDTVSTLLSFMSHELAMNQNVQEKLYQEIRTIANENKTITYEIIQKMKYLDMCISETLRKWPPAGLTDRVTSQSCQLEYDNGKKLQLNIGDGFFIPIYAIQRDEKYFNNPDEFLPERFSDENINNILSGTYMPFGIGPRICIGSRFALMETKAIFYYLLLNFRLEKCDKTQVPLRLGKGITSIAEKGFWLQIKQR